MAMSLVPAVLKKKRLPTPSSPAGVPAQPMAPGLIGQPEQPKRPSTPAGVTPPTAPDPTTGARPPAAAPGPGVGAIVDAVQDGAHGVSTGDGSTAPVAPGKVGGGTTVFDDAWKAGDERDGTDPNDPYGATNDKIQSVIDRLLTETGDTAEEEGVMREQNDRLFGQALVNQRASLGRSMGGGGGAAALEGDLRSQNALDLSDRLLDLRREEDQRSKDNALDAIGAETDMREWASDDAIMRMKLDLLEKSLGIDGEKPAAGGETDVGQEINDRMLWFNEDPNDAVRGTPDEGPNYVDGENIGQSTSDAGTGETIRAGSTEYLVREGKQSDDDTAMPPYRVTVDGKQYRTFRDAYGNPYVVPA